MDSGLLKQKKGHRRAPKTITKLLNNYHEYYRITLNQLLVRRKRSHTVPVE